MQESDIQVGDVIRIHLPRQKGSRRAMRVDQAWLEVMYGTDFIQDRDKASLFLGREARVTYIMQYNDRTYFHVQLLADPTIISCFTFDFINRNCLWRNGLEHIQFNQTNSRYA